MPAFTVPRGKARDVNVTELDTPVGIAEFELESEPIPWHGVATNGACGTGSRPSPSAHLMLTWKHAGTNGSARLFT
jgi:hypothetical protein